MLNKSLWVRDVDLEQVEAQVAQILARVDAGDFDEELGAEGVERPAAVALASSVHVTQSQGVGPDLWQEVLIAVGAPIASEVLKAIWSRIVMPGLKRVFREDRIREDEDAD